ncbi:MAG: DUF2589 domain-containing protein [Halopseudomonas sp.]
MADNAKSLIGAEFQALPLDFLISSPLVAAVNAQRVAAESTKSFIQSMIDPTTKKPLTVEFSVDQVGEDGKSKSIAVNAPLLAMVPVPHLRIDSLSIHFTFEISQTYRDAKETQASISTSVASGKALSPWVSASIKGSASSKGSRESTLNRSGQLDITVNASESEMPEGLARVLSLMTSAIQAPKPA